MDSKPPSSRTLGTNTLRTERTAAQSELGGVLPASLSERDAQRVAANAFGLTRRESEVAIRMLVDRDDGETALLMRSHPATVKQHKKAVRRKLGVHTCRQAAVLLLAMIWQDAAGS